MAGTTPLSVVVLTKNESGRIADCLRTVQWAGEALVVDDGSTDDTVRIAESLGARVVHRRMDLEGRHRNWAHAQAAHDWVLSLDADERVTPELAKEIQALFASGVPPRGVYAIPRRNYIGRTWVRHGGWYPSPQVKLFDRRVFRWEETTVHPRALSDVPGSELTADLIHLSYRDIGDFVGKMNRHTSLEAQKWLTDGRRVTFSKAAWRAVDRFWRSYVGKRGYKDGFYGYVVAVLAGMYQLISWTKYTEARLTARIEDVLEPFKDVAIDEERYDTAILMSHLCAYRLTGSVSRDRRVLEIGSGRGYGAYYLAHLAREVVGMDLDAVAIERSARLFQRPNLAYRAGSATPLAFPDGAFDVLGTFQVIEHIPEPQLPQFVSEMARALSPDGVAVISTLNLDHNRKNDRYQKFYQHEKEFTAPELAALLRGAFAHVTIYGLYPNRRYRLYRRLKKWGLRRWDPVRRFYEQLSTDEFCLQPTVTRQAIDLIAVCRRSPPTNGRDAEPRF